MCRTWSAIRNASAKVVFSLASRNRFWFGITIRVSTHVLQLGQAVLGQAHAVRALEVERLGDHADGEDALLARGAGDHGRRPGAGAAAHAGGDEHHVGCRRGARRISPRLSSAAARPTSGRRPAPSPCVTVVPSWTRRSARQLPSAWASVLQATNSTPSRRGRDHVVDRVAAGAADAHHGDARLQLVRRSARLRLIVISFSSMRSTCPASSGSALTRLRPRASAAGAGKPDP